MQVFANGINYRTGRLLVEPVELDDFIDRLLGSLQRNAEQVRRLTLVSGATATFRGELERERSVDLGDPRAAGWTFLLNAADPNRQAIIDAIGPLAVKRGMPDPAKPLLFHDESPDEWPDWLLENYSSLSGVRPPHYVLIVGEPNQVPFQFQALLDAVASVGRVAFNQVADLRTYVEKMIRLEGATDATTRADAIVFATDGGPKDPTSLSRQYMAEPLSKHLRDTCKCRTDFLPAQQATKANLISKLRGAQPALVYTATHGLGAPSEPLEIQKRFNGAICCQPDPNGPGGLDDLFTADDVPMNEPFLEGSVFFQFACYGYGTPAESDYMHWLGKPELNSSTDFIAALPKQLLAHPHGPLAYIGHVDTAWLHGFDDPEAPHVLDKWHPRIEPFVYALNELLRVQPAGLAMANMNMRYNVMNARLTSTFDRLQRGKLQVTPEFRNRLGDAFILRSDAQNYMIFGDPATRLRIPTS